MLIKAVQQSGYRIRANVLNAFWHETVEYYRLHLRASALTIRIAEQSFIHDVIGVVLSRQLLAERHGCWSSPAQTMSLCGCKPGPRIVPPRTFATDCLDSRSTTSSKLVAPSRTRSGCRSISGHGSTWDFGVRFGRIEFSPEERNRVQYGIDVNRRPKGIAVPFVATDMPSSRSEFTDPDVFILLTTFAY